VLLYALTTLVGFREYQATGMMYGYPLSISILFVPIYEEILFRGFILEAASKRMDWRKALVLTSVLFALWHLKNIFFLPPGALIYQMAYAGFIVSPILSYITLKTRTIWPAVILHYLNNLAAPLSWVILSLLFHG
jgi:membrane protease YdiL (CAAX protease family)